MGNWERVPTDERHRFVHLYNTGRLTLAHADRYDMKLQTLERRVREWRRLHPPTPTEPLFPDSSSPDYADMIHIAADDFIVISDIEIPDHDPAMLDAVLWLGKAQNIKTLVIAGDLIATDQTTLNSWDETWATEQPTYARTITMTIDVLRRFETWFDRIVIIQGNHDDRIARQTGGEVWYGMLLMSYLGDGVTMSRYAYCYVTTCRGQVYICHQHNYSKTPVKLGQELYIKENGAHFDPRDRTPQVEPCHIVLTHTHLQQWGWSPDGVREIHSLGCLRDPIKTRYARQSANKHYQWNQGFLMVKGGYFTPLSRHGTNWRMLLGDFADKAEIA